MKLVRIVFLFWVLSTASISCADADIETPSTVTLAATIISNSTVTPVSLQIPIGSSSPTIIPFPSPQSTPCTPFCTTMWSATPLPSPEDYFLKPWRFDDALEVITILDNRWEYFIEENDYWYYGMMVVNQERVYTAFVAQEMIWRFPENSKNDDLGWQIALDLAVAGRQEASNILSDLLEETLNQQDDLQEPNLSILWQKGFVSEMILMPNLSSNGSSDWIVKVTKRYDEMPIMQWDGALLSIRKLNKSYVVTPIDSFWMPWHGSKYEVSANTLAADNIPEIIVIKETSAGTGSAFKGAYSCIYQWEEDKWLQQPNNIPCNAASSSATLWAGDVSNSAQEMLFSGVDPNEVIAELQAALADPDFRCYGEYCTQVYYLLGLSYEIMGDKENAVETYWQLWSDYPESPQAIIVQHKLEREH